MKLDNKVRGARRRVVLALGSLLPLTMGGCAGGAESSTGSGAPGASGSLAAAENGGLTSTTLVPPTTSQAGDPPSGRAPTPAPTPAPGGPGPQVNPSPVPPLDPALPAWAQSVPLLHWARIPGTNLSRVEPRNYVGATGPRSKIDAWCGAAYSRLRRAYIIAAAGGHGDYANNEVNVIRLGQNSPVWEEVLASSPVSAMRNGEVYEDGRRASTHSYWGTQYIESLDRTFLFQCYGTDTNDPRIAGLPRSYPGSDYIMAFNHATGDWDAPDRWARWPNGRDSWFGALGCLNVKTGEAFVTSQYDGGNLRRFNPQLNNWTTVMRLDNAIFCAQAIDPKRNKILQVGGYQVSAPRVIDLNAKTYANVTFGGLGEAALTMRGEYAGMVFDELNDCFYVFPQGDAAQLLRVRASDWYVDRPTISGTSPGSRVNGWQNSWQYDPALKGIVCAVEYSSDMVYLRTSA